MAFIHYPDITDPDFHDKIYWKKEFHNTETSIDHQYKSMDEACNPSNIFTLQLPQEFIRNFISPETPYNGVLLMHGTGVGKTCASLGIAESLRDYIHKMGKMIYVIASETVCDNFRRELYYEEKALRERKLHLPAGSLHCVGNRYFPPPNKENLAKERAVNMLINQYYMMSGSQAFCNMVDHDKAKGSELKDEINHDYILNKFADSLIIIDEAHNLTRDTENETEKEKETSRVVKPSASGKLKLKKPIIEVSDAVLKSNKPDSDSDSDSESTTIRSDDKEDKEDKEEQEEYDKQNALLQKKQRQQSKYNLYEMLKIILPILRKHKKKMKIVMLTATPMKDKPLNIVQILEILNLNDYVEIDKKRLFPESNAEIDNETFTDKFDEKYLKQVAKGYISYIRSNNPITFPESLLPKDLRGISYIYQPNPLLNIKGQPFEEKGILKTYKTLNSRTQFNLLKCEMSLYQYKSYLSLFNTGEDVNPKNETDLQIASIITLPSSSNDLNLITTSDSSATFTKSFDSCFTVITKTEIIGGKKKNIISYKINEQILNSFGNFLRIDDYEIKIEGKNKKFQGLPLYSSKLSLFIQYVNTSPGIVFAYCYFKDMGVVLISLILEANGYVHYHKDLRFGGDGRPIQLYNLFKQDIEPIRSHTVRNNFRCAVCGLLFDQCRSKYKEKKDETEDDDDDVVEDESNKDDAESSIIPHKFIQATYVFYTGDSKMTDSHRLFSDVILTDGNKHGQKIKIIVGTRVISEGVDYKNVRQVHILNPWHNNTRIYQAIGRGIRYCGHVSLSESERNCTVFKYSSTVPDYNFFEPYVHDMSDLNQVINYRNGTPSGIIKRQLLSETIDERYYRRAISKDIYIKRVERALKKIAIDCQFNKNLNFYPMVEGRVAYDRDYSRECDYDKCDYQCEGFQKDIRYIIIGIKRIKKDEDKVDDLGLQTEDDELQPENDELQPEEISHTYRIQSHSLYNDSEWHDDTEEINEDKSEILGLIIDHYKIDLKEDAEFTFEQLYRAMEKILNVRTLSDGTNVIYDDFPVTDEESKIDISTYNIYFAKPQIDIAKIVIKQIFQRTYVMNIEGIIYFIHKINKKIDIPFIYSALDQITGTGLSSAIKQGILPEIVFDRYNRPGIIIYRKGYYIFQPNELKYQSAPLSFRIKPYMTRISSIVPYKEVKVISNEIFTNTYEELLKFNGKMVKEYKDNKGFNYADTVIQIHKFLDRLIIILQAYLIEQIIIERRTYALLSEIIIEYYQHNQLLQKNDEGQFYHLLIDIGVRKFNDDTNTWETDNYESKIKLLRPVSKVFGFLATTGSRMSGMESFDGDTLFSQIKKSINTFLKSSVNDSGTLKKQLIFKIGIPTDISDGNTRKGTYTKCQAGTLQQQPKLKVLLETLIKDSMKNLIRNNPDLHLSDRFKAGLSKNISNDCELIENFCRILDLYDQEKQWFLNYIWSIVHFNKIE